MNFFGQLLTSDNEPVGQEQLQSIIKERYLISKNLHTSYSDIGKITPLERNQLVKLIVDDLE